MHALFEGSEESKGEGLGIINKKIKKLTLNPCPHMGWNNLVKRKSSSLLNGLFDEDFYFAHSFGIGKINESISISIIDDFIISSCVKKNNFIGVQFHPEKSGIAGLEILKNFGNKL